LNLPLGLVVLVLSLGVVPSAAFAHASWFVDGSLIDRSITFQVDQFYIFMIALTALFLVSAFCAEALRRKSAIVERVLGGSYGLPGRLEWRVLAVLVGATLIVNSMLHIFIAPNIQMGNGALATTAYFVQIVVGSMFLLQSHVTAAAVMCIILPIACLIVLPFSVMIDYQFELIGIGLAFYLMAPVLSSRDRQLQKKLAGLRPTQASLHVETGRRSMALSWPRSGASVQRVPFPQSVTEREARAVSMLRIAFGLQFVVLALHEKLINPGLALAFVDQHSFVNFMPLLGFEGFTNLHFVFGAGLAELTLGLLMAASVATRLACGILAAVFLVTGVMFGPHELVGHLPILGTLLLVMVRGSANDVAGEVESGVDTEIAPGLARQLAGRVSATIEPLESKPARRSVAARRLAQPRL
jgi:hypothetical protein